MRFTLLFALVLMSTPALAGGWYINERFGYEIVLPDALSLVAESEAKDAASFASADNRQILNVWAGEITAENFEAEMTLRLKLLDPDSWAVTAKIITPDTMHFSGSKSGQASDVHAIALCNGQYAFFQYDYPLSQLHKLKAAIETLTTGFKPIADC